MFSCILVQTEFQVAIAPHIFVVLVVQFYHDGKFDFFITLNAPLLASVGHLLLRLLIWMLPKTNPETNLG